MKKMKLVTVIIPVYNAEEYLDRCIKSVINQSYKNIEIILVDDGSTDNSGSICDKYKDVDKRIKTIHKENAGVSEARNSGLEMASGYYINFVDADDYIDKDMIRKLVTAIENTKSEIAICNYYYNKSTNLENTMSVTNIMEKILSKKYFRGYVFNKLYKKELINKIRFHSDIYIAEDLLFNCEYLLKCKKCSYLNEKLYYYCDNKNSTLNKKINSKYLTIIDAYEKIEKIYKENYSEIIEKLYEDILKIICDIIYRNSKNCEEERLNIMDLMPQKKKYYKILMNSKKISIYKKAEIYIYSKFPIFIGNLRSLKKAFNN